MKTQLAKWGNSLAIRIPKHVASAAKLSMGDDLDVEADGPGKVKIRKPKRKISLDQLIARISPENRHEEINWGNAVGKESW